MRPKERATTRRAAAYRSFLAAMIIDSAGSGLWLPFSIIYFVYARGLPLRDVGIALTAGSLIALCAGGLAVGVLTDRLGAFPAVALSSAVRACAFPVYLVVGNPVAVAAVATAVSFGDRLFWASHGGVVAAFRTDTAGRTKLFATINRMRNVGLGLGALAVAVGAAAEGVRSTGLYTAILLLNAVSFAVAALLLLRARRAGEEGEDAAAERSAGASAARHTYRDLLADRPFVLYTLVNVVFALSANSFSTALPIFLLGYSGMPPWMPGVIYVTVCITLLASKPLVNALATRHDALRLRRDSAWLAVAYFAALPLVPVLGATAGFAVALVLVVVFTLGEAVQAAVMTAVVLDFSPPAARGRYNAFFQLSWGTAGAIGPALFGTGLTLSPTGLWFGMAVLVLFAGIAIGRIRPAVTAAAS